MTHTITMFLLNVLFHNLLGMKEINGYDYYFHDYAMLWEKE
jgi:hypothetical protein